MRQSMRQGGHNCAYASLALLGMCVVPQRVYMMNVSPSRLHVSPLNVSADPSLPSFDPVDALFRTRPHESEESLPLEFRWMAQYERMNLEPIGFEGYIDAPPAPPRSSLMSIMLSKQSKAARKRRASKRARAVELGYNETDSNANTSVCVILTNFNNAEFINSTIVDILTQTFTGPFVVVAVDDFSTDGSRDALYAWAKEERRLIPVLLPGRSMGGTGIPSNIGLDVCRDYQPPFKYVAFVDGDDALQPDFLEHLVNVGEETQAEVIISDFDIWSRGGDPVGARKANSELNAWIKLPKDIPLDPMRYFSPLAALMPAPWRKMLRLDYLIDHNLRFPEGDFFYEDNVLHWLILLSAERVVVSDSVLVHHRTSRSVFGVHEVRNAGFFAVLNIIGDAVLASGLDPESAAVVASAFIMFADRLKWIIKRQRNAKMREKFAACFTRFQAYWLPRLQQLSGLPLAFIDTTNASRVVLGLDPDPTPHDLDLSIVVPVYNAEPFVDGLIARLDVINQLLVRYEVFFINGASTDGSARRLSAIAETRDHVYDIQLMCEAAAGFLRNLVVPLLEGRYVFFLDSDDSVNPAGLEAAVLTAMRQQVDVLMLPYQLEFVSQSGTSEVSTLMGMDKYDQLTWSQVTPLEMTAATREAAMTLVNYPWNRLTRTQLLHEENLFFGTTQVQNDVQYHWHALSAAERVAFLNSTAKPVCYHKKFVGTKRMQLTKIRSSRRLEMFWALQATHRVLCAAGDPFTDDPSTMQVWGRFVERTLHWARTSNLVPRASMPKFLKQQAEMLECTASCSMRCLYSQWTPQCWRGNVSIC